MVRFFDVHTDLRRAIATAAGNMTNASRRTGKVVELEQAVWDHLTTALQLSYSSDQSAVTGCNAAMAMPLRLQSAALVAAVLHCGGELSHVPTLSPILSRRASMTDATPVTLSLTPTGNTCALRRRRDLPWMACHMWLTGQTSL